MQDCPVCGRAFDPLAFQVVVPELARGFDGIDCAQSARALGASGLAVAPLVAVGAPLEAALTPARAVGSALRPLVGAPVAAVGLLAAGTAAAAYLWVGVLGADTPSFPVDRAAAPAAFGHETVQAHAQISSSTPVARNPSERPALEAVGTLVAAGPPAVAPTPAGGFEGSEPPTPDTPPEPPAAPPPTVRPSPPPVARPSRSRPEGDEDERGGSRHGQGQGHPKLGEGHYKHGEENGVHSPGHGHGHGKSESAANGHGKGQGHNKGNGH